MLPIYVLKMDENRSTCSSGAVLIHCLAINHPLALTPTLSIFG